MADEIKQSPDAAVDENHLIAERKAKLERLRERRPHFQTISAAMPLPTSCTRRTGSGRPNGSTRIRRR
jgi:hypothetical protein